MSNIDEKWAAIIAQQGTPIDTTTKPNLIEKTKDVVKNVDYEKGLEVATDIVENMTWTRIIEPILGLSYLTAKGIKTTYDIGMDPDRNYKESMGQFGKSTQAYLGEQAVLTKQWNEEYAKARQPYKEQYKKGLITLPEYVSKDVEISKQYAQKLGELSSVQGAITGVEVAATLIATKLFGGAPAMVGLGVYELGKVLSNKNLTPREKVVQGTGAIGASAINASLFNLGESALTVERAGKVTLDATKLKNLKAARVNGTITELDNFMLDTVEKYAKSLGTEIDELAGKKLDINDINKLIPDEIMQRSNFETLKDMTNKSVSRLISKSKIKVSDTEEIILNKLSQSNKALKTAIAKFTEEDLGLIAKGVIEDPKFKLQKSFGDISVSLDNPSVYGKDLLKGETPKQLFDEALTSPMSFWIKLDGKGNPAKLALEGKQAGAWYNTIGRATIEAENRGGQAIRAAEDYTKQVGDIYRRSKSPSTTSIGGVSIDKEKAIHSLLLYYDPRNKLIGRSIKVNIGNNKVVKITPQDMDNLAKQYPEIEEIANILRQKNSVIGRMIHQADLDKTGKPVVLADEYLVKRVYSNTNKQSNASYRLSSLKDELEEIKSGSKKILTPGTLKQASEEIPKEAVFDLSKGLLKTIRSHDEDVSAYVKTAPTIPIYKNLIALKSKLVEKFGDAGYQRIIANMDKSFLPSDMAGFATDRGITNVLNKATSNVIGSKLGNKPVKLGLIQTTQIFPIANVAGWKNTIQALRQISKEPEILSYIMAKSKVFNNRYNSVGLEDYLNNSFGSESLKYAKKLPLIGMQAMDKNMAAISWLAGKNKAMQIPGMTTRGAEAIADDVLLMTQPQTMMAARSAMETTPYIKYTMLFKTQQKQMLDRTAESLSALKNAPKRQKVKFLAETGKDVFYNQTLPALVGTVIDYMFMSGAVRSEDDPVGAEEQLARQTKQSTLGVLPIVGDILYAMSDDGRNSKYELDSPLLRSISDIVDALDRSGKSLKDFVDKTNPEVDQALEDLMKLVAQAVAISTGGNVNPVIDTAAALTDVRLGEQTKEWSRILGIKQSAEDRKSEGISDDPIVNALRKY